MQGFAEIHRRGWNTGKVTLSAATACAESMAFFRAAVRRRRRRRT